MTAGEGFGDERIEQGGATGPVAPEHVSEPAAASGPDRLGALEELTARPLAEHPGAYEQLHAELRSALAEIDDA